MSFVRFTLDVVRLFALNDGKRKAHSKHGSRMPGKLKKYCRFGNFCENFIFANSIKRHISDVKNSRLRQQGKVYLMTE